MLLCAVLYCIGSVSGDFSIALSGRGPLGQYWASTGGYLSTQVVVYLSTLQEVCRYCLIRTLGDYWKIDAQGAIRRLAIRE